MNSKIRLLTPIAMLMGVIGVGSFAIANLTVHNSSNSTIAQKHEGMNHEMAMTSAHKESMMMSMSLGKADAGFDRRFLDAMIPHHQGAVTMAKDSLQKSKRPELKKLAQNIITSQQLEIDRMTQWHQKWYGNK